MLRSFPLRGEPMLVRVEFVTITDYASFTIEVPDLSFIFFHHGLARGFNVEGQINEGNDDVPVLEKRLRLKLLKIEITQRLEELRNFGAPFPRSKPWHTSIQPAVFPVDVFRQLRQDGGNVTLTEGRINPLDCLYVAHDLARPFYQFEDTSIVLLR